ncbi:hypothetical protein C8R44DRAFT_886714 [Mycena epipterygia]|nr:hypothetical protein C8R44DRAFT_886714 [Mycena epipterygia]
MGFTVRELMALIGAHFTGKQRFQASPAQTTFYTTLEVWDVRFCEHFNLLRTAHSADSFIHTG